MPNQTYQPRRRVLRNGSAPSMFFDGRKLSEEASDVIVRLRKYASSQGFSLQSVVLAAIDEYLATHDNVV